MTQKIKKYCCFLLLFGLLAGFAACQREKEEPMDEAPSIIPIEESQMTPAVTFTPTHLQNITFYTLSDSMTKEEATAVLSEDTVLTPEYMVDYVVASMEDVDLQIKVSSVVVQESKVIVSFEEDTVPVVHASAALETEILDCIAQSILENCEEYTSVIYRVLDRAYRSENTSFEINHVYLGN